MAENYSAPPPTDPPKAIPDKRISEMTETELQQVERAMHVFGVPATQAEADLLSQKLPEPLPKPEGASALESLALDALLNQSYLASKAMFEKQIDKAEAAVRNRKRDAKERELEHQSTHDELTGLYNRRGFFEQACKTIQSAQPGDTFTVAFIDLDNFKAVNDMYGHEEGDKALKKTATELHKVLPDSVIARTGGDEFVALIKVVPRDEMSADEIADRILEDAKVAGAAYGKENRLNDFGYSIGRSPLHNVAGEMTAEATDQLLNELIREADEAMYLIKPQRERAARQRP